MRRIYSLMLQRSLLCLDQTSLLLTGGSLCITNLNLVTYDKSLPQIFCDFLPTPYLSQPFVMQGFTATGLHDHARKHELT